MISLTRSSSEHSTSPARTWSEHVARLSNARVREGGALAPTKPAERLRCEGVADTSDQIVVTTPTVAAGGCEALNAIRSRRCAEGAGEDAGRGSLPPDAAYSD